MLKLSTRIKAVSGYVILAVFFIATILFIVDALSDLIVSDGEEMRLNHRQQAANEVVVRLYQAEVTGQALSAGKSEYLQDYATAMMNTASAVDSLRVLTSDKVQIARIDSVKILLQKKVDNMEALLVAVESDNSEALYQEYIDELLREQAEAINVPQVANSEVVRTDEYTVAKERKNFFGRLRDAFSRRKNDTVRVSSTTREVHSDTLMQSVNPTDSVVRLLSDVRDRVGNTRLRQIEELNRQIQVLRENGMELSREINRLLAAIVDDSARSAAMKLSRQEEIRQNAMRTLAATAIVSVSLAIAFLIVIWRDITRSNRYRRELEAAKQKAESLLAMREKLMLAITHDIKAPVGSIIGYSDLLGRITTEERQRFYLDNMRSSADHLLKLVNSLLDFHRLDANKMEVAISSFNPKQLLDTIYVSHKPAADAKRLLFDYECDATLDGVFAGDPFRIRQIVENLITNALKFTQEGHIGLSAAWDDGCLLVCVSDSGCGISDADKQRIFNEFTRLRSAQGQEGFGLGLSITQKLVQLLDGSIDVESEEGEGSRFFVRLPLGSGVEAEAEEGKPEDMDAAGRFRVLLIDDDRLQLQLTAAMLETAGSEAVCCTNSEELFCELDKQRFDAVLTDIQMPEINGFDLSRAICEYADSRGIDLPIIAVTARDDMDAGMLSQHGFSGCLHKPFSQRELLEAIGNAAGVAGKMELQTPHEAGHEGSGYDFSALTAFSGDDKAASAEIINTFIAETEANMSRMRDALDSGNLEELSAAAHKMLPLFSMIGAMATTQLAELDKRRGKTELADCDRDAARIVLEEAACVVEEAHSVVEKFMGK